jgi:hypothetical protein
MSQIMKEIYTQPVLTKHERLVDITATASHGNSHGNRKYKTKKIVRKKRYNKRIW